MAGNGWCTHPKRQLSSDVRILVRHGELACRNSWGNDFWEDRDTVDQPLAASAPPAPPVEAPTTVRASFDDEVTSVVTSDAAGSSRPGESDIVVEQTSLLPDEPSSVARRGYRPGDLNEAAHQDQQERVDLMRRGSRDAIERARERHRLRRGHQEPGTEQEDEDDQPAPGVSEPHRAFAPDDYIETEGPSPARHTVAADETTHDVVIQEHATPPSLRGRRLRRDRGTHTETPIDVVPASEVSPETKAQTTRHVDDPRFDSIPEIKPEIDLSRLRRREPEQSTPTSSPEHAPEGVASAYDEVLKRAQAIKAAARSEREARQQQARRPIAVPLRQREEAVQTPNAEPERDPAHGVEPVAFSMDAYDAPDEPDPTSQTEVPAVQPTWLTSSPGIRFRRPQVTEPVDQPEDVWEADADAEAYAEPDEAYDDEELPEPVVRRRWWRGLLPGRQRTNQLTASGTYNDEDWTTASFEETAEANDAAYAESYDDAWAEDDSDLDVEASWDEDDAHEPAETWLGPEAEPAPLRSTSDQAFEEDAHHFVERRYTEAPWRDETTSEEPAAAEEAPSGFTAQASAERYYEPLDLDNTESFSAFRSRLFAGEASDEAPRPHPDSTTRIDAAVPRRHRMDAPVTRTAPVAMQAEELLQDPRDAMYDPPVEPSFDIRAIVAQQHDMLDMTIAVAPEVPRVCATCRSYRASEQGERGWCTNGWAFTHRQMVNADDLACQSTIGCWWLPADDVVWLEDEEQRALTEPTPRIDRLVAHLLPLRRTAER
jgi:hypothetical protein